MARITMSNSQKATFAEIFEIYISAVTARGVKDKTIATYKQHFHAISKRLDVSLPINRLNSTLLDNMILQMRKEGLSDSSINSYTRTLKCFLSWCNEEGYIKAKRKLDQAKCQTWGDLNPVTGQPENSKAYNRNKARNWKREISRNPVPGLLFATLPHSMLS